MGFKKLSHDEMIVTYPHLAKIMHKKFESKLAIGWSIDRCFWECLNEFPRMNYRTYQYIFNYYLDEKRNTDANNRSS